MFHVEHGENFMIETVSDTIVAPGTPASLRAPLACVRLSGPLTQPILDAFLRLRSGQQLSSWHMHFGDWVDEGGLLDDVTVAFYRAPRSYTGQDMAEIFCHGNPLFVEEIMRDARSRGARPARPGEFTLRAVLAGKMDLIQAETVHEVVHARTRWQAELARTQASGPLASFSREIVEQLLQVEARLEASIDYADEGIDPPGRRLLLQTLQQLAERLGQVGRSAPFARGLRRGFRVLLTGAPNSGKSSLFNALLACERALVSHLPGTTRDLVSEELELGGLPVVLIDSAGVRESEDPIEQMGIARILSLLGEVDLVLYLEDAGQPCPPYPELAELPAERVLHLISKADLLSEMPGKLSVSTRQPESLTRLVQAIVVQLSAPLQDQAVWVTSARQEELLERARLLLEQTASEFAEGFGEEIVSASLRQARRALAELVGSTGVEDVLERMFSQFCLGK